MTLLVSPFMPWPTKWYLSLWSSRDPLRVKKWWYLLMEGLLTTSYIHGWQHTSGSLHTTVLSPLCVHRQWRSSVLCGRVFSSALEAWTCYFPRWLTSTSNLWDRFVVGCTMVIRVGSSSIWLLATTDGIRPWRATHTTIWCDAAIPYSLNFARIGAVKPSGSILAPLGSTI